MSVQNRDSERILVYFLFLDLGGYVNFVPGTVMTLVSASAILLSFYGYFKKDEE